MSEEEGGGKDMGGAFVFALIAGILLLVLWRAENPDLGYSVGGTGTGTETYIASESYNARSDDVESRVSDAYEELERERKTREEAALWGEISPLRGALTIESVSPNRDRNQEYITLRAAFDIRTPIVLSGLSLHSDVSGKVGDIGEGVLVPKKQGGGIKEPILLMPGATALITSGESPLGISFRENRCSGYLDEHQSFYPNFSHTCPLPEEELSRNEDIELSDDSCYAYITHVPQCRRGDRRYLDSLTEECQNFVEDTLTYEGCVANHHDRPHFTDDTWRIFLEEDVPLWRTTREIIKLVDHNGRTIDVYRY